MMSRRQLLQHAVFLPLTGSPAPVSTLPAGTPLQLVWVAAPGCWFDAAEAARVRGEIDLAMAYWNARRATGVYKVRERVVEETDPWRSHYWIQRHVSATEKVCLILPNQHNRRQVDLGGDVVAPAYHWPGTGCFFTSLWSSPAYAGVSVGCLAAHELGHALYALPEDAPGEPMMGQGYPEAWAAWVGRC